MEFKIPIEFKLDKRNENYVKRKLKQNFKENLKFV